MQLVDFLSPDRISCNVNAHSKKRALEELSALIAHDQQETTPTEIFDSLLSRERLGGTGIGYGVAIPHGRLKKSTHTTAALIHLKDGIDFDAIDNEPVDLLFALVIPDHATEDHLKILAMLASLFQNEIFRKQIRAANTPEEILNIVKVWQGKS